MSLSRLDYSLLLLLAVLLPLAMAFCLAAPSLRRRVILFAPLSAVPGLALALSGPTGLTLELPWLLKSVVLSMDMVSRVFLGFTSVLYIASAWQARATMVRDPHGVRFFAFLFASMSGNLGVILAADMPTFYFSFALMGLSSAGLVFHRGDDRAVRAGRLYLVMTMVGEVLVFLGLTTLVARAGTTMIGETLVAAHTPATLLLVAFGFGIKAGALALHFWLPLAHPAAPVPASAVLSGAMIKAGLLGWLRFLPLGYAALPAAGLGWVGVGLAAALIGAAAGALQRNPKTVLAWSSVAQMGIMMTGVGAGLVRPDAWPVILPALLVYVAHHGLAKGALFLGVAVAPAVSDSMSLFFTRVVLVIPALALAGAPFTSGAVAKVALKKNLAVLPDPWGGAVDLLLPLAAAGTTLLMIRFLVLAWPRKAKDPAPLPPGLWPPLAFAVMATLTGVWLLPGSMDWLLIKLEPALLWKAVWPLLFGSLLAWALHNLERRRRDREPEVPADEKDTLFDRLFVATESLLSPSTRASSPVGVQTAARTDSRTAALERALRIGEERLRSRPVSGALLVLVMVGLLALFALLP